MKKLKFTPTTEKIISENYPYGFKLKTTKTDYLEFSPKHGFRHCSQTINPKTGKTNNPKKSTYYNLMLLGVDEIGHCKSFVLDFNGSKEMQKVIQFLQVPANFDLFTYQQIEYFYIQLLTYSKVDAKARVIYCGSEWELLKPFYQSPIDEIVKGLQTKGMENVFAKIVFDWVAIDNLKVPNYKPFKVVEYGSVLNIVNS